MNRKLMLSCATVALALPARAFADLNFDATTVEPDAGFEVLPNGWYNVAIDESNKKPVQPKPGEKPEDAGWYLSIRFNILDGQYAGRKVYHNLNLKNSNQQTVEIAQRQLSAICHAVGVLQAQKSEQLHGIPLKIQLAFSKGKDGYADSNKITGFKNKDHPVDTAGGDMSAGAAAFGAGAPAGAGGAPANPWDQGAAQQAAAGATAPTEQPAQPWAQPPADNTGQAAPATPQAPAVPAAPATPAAPHDPFAAAVADGWVKHPTPGWYYKGEQVVADADVAAMYPAPAPATPAAPAAPAVPAAPAMPEAPAAGTNAPPWAQNKPA